MSFRETGWRHIGGIIVGAFALFPLLYIISASLNPGGSVFGVGAVLAAVLPVALFLALQKYIVGGLTAGSVE